MIIKKSMLNTHKKWRGTWPFSVDEVAVIKLNLGEINGPDAAYAIIHEYNPYALSGCLDNNFASLEDSGIWADEKVKAESARSKFGTPKAEIADFIDTSEIVKKSLTPFFEFLEWQSGGMG